jgi:hypothetical protein
MYMCENVCVCVRGHAHHIVVLLGYMFMLESCRQGGMLRMYVYVWYVCVCAWPCTSHRSAFGLHVHA